MLLQKRIHQWSTQLPAWQRDLLRRLTGGPLSEEEQDEVLAILTEASKAPAPKPLALGDLPVDEAEVGPVELREISDLKNINLLAGEQRLAFGPGINVVFGRTGAGKSGYGRLLRRLCRAAERSEVLRNVFDPGSANAPQTAMLKITAEGEALDVTVDLARDPDRTLSAMAAFDASCARVYLTGPNTIEHVPRPLLLLRLLSESQDALVRRLGEQAERVRSKQPPPPGIDPSTSAGQLAAAITATTDPAQLEKLAILTGEEREEINKLDVAAATIKSDQSGQLEAAARGRARGANTGANTLQDVSGRLTDERLKTVDELRTRLDSAIEAERKLAANVFSGQRFPTTGQGAWQEMWESARRFVESGGGTFPDTQPGAACPTCQQDLDEDARERMTKFEEFVRGDLRSHIAGLNRDLAAEVEDLPDIETVETRVDAALSEAPEEITGVAKEVVAALSDRAARARFRAQGKDENESPVVPALADLAPIHTYAREQAVAADAHAALRNEAEQRRVLSRLAELRAREGLAAALPTVRKRIAGLKKIARIEEAKGKLGTTGISHQLRQLQQAVITDRLRAAVEEELKELDPVAGKVEVVGQAAKGETVIQLKLKEPCRARVGEVLSDGEQRALALAFFLAEVAVSEGRSAIILDDPVSSLDLERRDYVARRLVEEAKRRQVVVFTHDLTFVYMLQEAAETDGQELHGQTLQRAFHRVGVVSDELPDKAMSPSRRRKQLRHRLQHELKPLYKREDPNYEREADLWVTDLRKGYDQLIEEYLLAGVVRRLHSQVRVHRLHFVKLSMDLVKRIEAAIKMASNKAHHEASELQPTAFTLDQLAEMLDEYDAICAETHPKKKGTVTAAVATDGSPDVELAAGLKRAS